MNALRAAAALLAALASQACVAGEARTVDIGMFDSMRFLPGELSVASGETIRFLVRNEGKVRHEIVIGSRADIARRRTAMQHEHEHGHEQGEASAMLHVAPGASDQLLWQFALPGQLEFACLLPGHYEAGMHGMITVLAKP